MAGEIYIADKPTLDATKTNTDVIKTDTNIIKADVKSIKSNFPLVINTDANYKYFHQINLVIPRIESKSQKIIFEINEPGYVNAAFFISTSSVDLFADIYINNEIIYSTGLASGSDYINGIFDMPSINRDSNIYKYGTLSISVPSNYPIIGINPSTVADVTNIYTTFIPEKLYFNNFKVVVRNTKSSAFTNPDCKFTFLGGKLNI